MIFARFFWVWGGLVTESCHRRPHTVLGYGFLWHLPTSTTHQSKAEIVHRPWTQKVKSLLASGRPLRNKNLSSVQTWAARVLGTKPLPFWTKDIEGSIWDHIPIYVYLVVVHLGVFTRFINNQQGQNKPSIILDTPRDMYRSCIEYYIQLAKKQTICWSIHVNEQHIATCHQSRGWSNLPMPILET